MSDIFKNLKRKLGKRRFNEVMDMALNKISNFTIERNPIILSGIVEGIFHYSTYIDENGDYCCSCLGQTSHKTKCKHIFALAIYGYLNDKISESELFKLIGDDIL